MAAIEQKLVGCRAIFTIRENRSGAEAKLTTILTTVAVREDKNIHLRH